MSDPVLAALKHARDVFKTIDTTKWTVLFRDQMKLYGTIQSLSIGNYVLMEGSRAFYFSGEQVMWLTPH